MSHALTATEVQQREYESRLRMASLKQQFREAATEESKNQLRVPKIAVVGFDDYAKLKMEVWASVAETLGPSTLEPAFMDCTTGPRPEPYNLLFPLTRLGVECFAWNGFLVCECKSVATGTFFL